MRLDKFISTYTPYSREESKKWIKKGLIKVDGIMILDASFHIDPTISKVSIQDEVIFYKKDVTLMLNKPKGYVSATKDGLHPTVLSLIKKPYDQLDLKIVGRLDIDTEGLLLLTTNGSLVHKLTSPNKQIFKTYWVEVDKKIEDMSVFYGEYDIFDGNGLVYKPHPPKITLLSDNTCLFSIDEGKFHQVKRMFAHFNYQVISLKRISIGPITLDDTLSLGDYKEIDIEYIETQLDENQLNL